MSGAMNPSAVFVPGSLSIVAGSVPPGVDISNTNPFGGTNSSGLIDVRNIDAAPGSEVAIQFDVTLQSALLGGTVVTNQADLVDTAKIADSDDPTVNGQADPDVAGDEDPTRILIQSAPYLIWRRTSRTISSFEFTAM